MANLFRREDADRVSVFFDGHAHFGEDGLALHADHFRPLQFILPGLVQLYLHNQHH